MKKKKKKEEEIKKERKSKTDRYMQHETKEHGGLQNMSETSRA